MFERAKVEAFVQAVSLAGKADKDKEMTIELEIYITPIDFNLACELDEDLADAIFHKLRNGVYKPRPVMPKAGPFIVPDIELQHMHMYPLKEDSQDHLGAMVSNVKISNINARRLFPEDEGMSLIFRASVPFDSLALSLAARYFKTKLWLTFKDMQPSLPLQTQGTTPLCTAPDCNLLAKVIDSTGKTFCRKHVRAGEGEVVEIGKSTRETPAEAQKRIQAEKEAEAESKGKKKRSGKDAAAGDDEKDETGSGPRLVN